MRLVPTALALAAFSGSMLVAAGDARAQSSCNDFTPQLHGDYPQVVLGNNSCAPLTNVSVTVAVTQDIIVAASNDGYNGFSIQLNANGPSSGLSASQSYWQQFVIAVGTTNLPQAWTAGVNGYTQVWANGAPLGSIYPANPMFMGIPSSVNDTFLRVPAGTTFTWTVNEDSSGNVVSITYSASDNAGTSYTAGTEYIPVADRAPIYSLALGIVGYNDGSYTTFQSGAGTITYNASNFSPSFDFPACARNTGTAENSDMAYGPMTQLSSGSFTQQFTASTVADFSNSDCGYPGTGYPSGDWAPGDYKGLCPLGAPMYGVSRIPGQLWSEDIECGMPGQAAYVNSGACYTRAVDDYDDRGDTDQGWDWDPGSYKAECAANEYVAGVSQASGNGVLTSILCCPAEVTHASCDAQVFYDSDSPAFSGQDWDPAYYKGQCPAGQYVAGISSPAYTSVGAPGAAHAVLCCSQ